MPHIPYTSYVMVFVQIQCMLFIYLDHSHVLGPGRGPRNQNQVLEKEKIESISEGKGPKMNLKES